MNIFLKYFISKPSCLFLLGFVFLVAHAFSCPRPLLAAWCHLKQLLSCYVLKNDAGFPSESKCWSISKSWVWSSSQMRIMSSSLLLLVSGDSGFDDLLRTCLAEIWKLEVKRYLETSVGCSGGGQSQRGKRNSCNHQFSGNQRFFLDIARVSLWWLSTYICVCVTGIL